MGQRPALEQLAEEFLKKSLGCTVTKISSVSGGFIAAAFKATTSAGESYFIKGLDQGSRAFEREAYALGLIGEYFRVPEVMATSENFLILEWIESSPAKPNSYESFGRNLARMHKQALAPNQLAGFPFDNTIGATLQLNENQSATWSEFFWSHRLSPQLEWAQEKGFAFTKDEVKAVKVACEERLSALKESTVSLLHGDLWGGNHKFTESGEPWLYDPSSYYGHREADLAMMRLFHGFPRETFDSYELEFPLEQDWSQRLGLYQLYHVLNHVNLFGGSYYQQAKGLIKDIR